MDNSQSFPQILLKNGFVMRPITEDIAERCAEIGALSFSQTNPFAIALGKTYEEEKARLMKNIKICMEDPFTHCIMDGNEIVSVNFCCKIKDCYLASAMNDDFDESQFTEKQLLPLRLFRKLYMPYKQFLGNKDYVFEVYALNPEYKKKNNSVVVYSQIFHYISLYYGGIRDLNFTTNSKMQNLILKLANGYNIGNIDLDTVEFQGKKIYEGVDHGCLGLNVFGYNPNPLEEYKYLGELIPKYLDQLNLKPNYQMEDSLIEKHIETLKLIEQSKSRRLNIQKITVPKPSL